MKLTLDNDIFLLPEQWDELSKEQLLRIAKLSQLKLGPNQFRFYLLMAILGIDGTTLKPIKIKGEICYRVKIKKRVYVISLPDIGFTVSNCLAFLFKETKIQGEIHLIIDCSLSRFLITKIYSKGIAYYAPSNALENCSYEEYIRCLICNNDYSSGDKSAIDKLIATLYRKASANPLPEDIREPYNDFLVEQNAKKLESLFIDTKIAILMQFNGALSILETTFPNVFQKQSKKFDHKLNSKNLMMQQMDMLDNLAKHSPTEKEKLLKTNLYSVLHTLNNLLSK